MRRSGDTQWEMLVGAQTRDDSDSDQKAAVGEADSRGAALGVMHRRGTRWAQQASKGSPAFCLSDGTGHPERTARGAQRGQGDMVTAAERGVTHCPPEALLPPQSFTTVPRRRTFRSFPI